MKCNFFTTEDFQDAAQNTPGGIADMANFIIEQRGTIVFRKYKNGAFTATKPTLVVEQGFVINLEIVKCEHPISRVDRYGVDSEGNAQFQCSCGKLLTSLGFKEQEEEVS